MPGGGRQRLTCDAPQPPLPHLRSPPHIVPDMQPPARPRGKGQARKARLPNCRVDTGFITSREAHGVETPDDRRYAQTHEWAKQEADLVRVGISDFAQEQLGDIVFLELPPPDRRVQQGEALGTVESVKAVADLWAPVSGEVVEVNADLADRPELVNEDPYGRGWMVAIRPADPDEVASLMDAPAYAQHCEESTP